MRAAEAEALRLRVEAEARKWRAVAQDELTERMQISKDRRLIQLEIQQTQAALERSQRRRSGHLPFTTIFTSMFPFFGSVNECVFRTAFESMTL
jgi:hypothetical protein